MRRILLSLAVVVAVISLGERSDPAAASKAPKAGSQFVVGVVSQSALGPEDMQLMQSGSVDSFRHWLNWSAIEPAPGRFDWSGPDKTIGEAAAQGIGVLPGLYGTPGWAAAADGQDCVGEECTAFAPRSEATRAAFALFAAAAVRRYGPGGTFWLTHPDLPYTPLGTWQVWIEQNSPTFFAPAPDAHSYAALLTLTAAAIRAADPAAEVVLGGMWGTRGVSEHVTPTAAYLRQLYREPGIEASFDAIAVHPYSSNVKGIVKQVKTARNVAKRAGDRGVGLWVTEFGWASSGPSSEYLVATPRKQAKLLREAYLTLNKYRRAWRIRGAYWYAWRDTPREGAVCAWCPGAGLFTEAGAAKPAFLALSALSGRL